MEKRNLHQRILAVMAEINYVRKEDKRVNNQYTFVSHDRVAEVLHPQLVKHGIVMIPSIAEWRQDGNRTEVQVEVAFVNADDPTDRITSRWLGFGIDPQDKGPGKAVSYATKYALLKTFVLETGDDVERDNIDHIGKAAAASAEEAKAALARGDWLALVRMNSSESFKDAWSLIGSKDRAAIKKLTARRDEYRDQINLAADKEDDAQLGELWQELTTEEKRAIWEVLSPAAQTMLKAKKEAA